jgi:hypothetical protein
MGWPDEANRKSEIEGETRWHQESCSSFSSVQLRHFCPDPQVVADVAVVAASVAVVQYIEKTPLKKPLELP